MKPRRKNREPLAQTPAPAPAGPAVDETIKALQERLELLESGGPRFDPGAARRREHELWIQSHTRTDHEDACLACGLAGGEQRRTWERLDLLAAAWLCVACTAAVDPGWGTATRTRRARRETLDRLACLAAGLGAPTPGFLTLAGRYGLGLTLARDADGGPTGAAWGHLDVREWARVGALAERRHEAGHGVLPNLMLLRSERRPMVLATVFDPSVPRGRRLGHVPAPDEEGQTRAWDVDALRTEEQAIEQVLKDRARERKEREAEQEREQERERIRAHYLEHVERLEAEISGARAALRADYRKALDAAL